MRNFPQPAKIWNNDRTIHSFAASFATGKLGSTFIDSMEAIMSLHQNFLAEDFSDREAVDPAVVAGGHPVLIVPGLNNSDEHHWQSLWQQEIPQAQRIEVAQWHLADLHKWRTAIRNSLQTLHQPALLIAHSFGALAAASYAADFPEQIAGLFLVAPADPDKFGIAEYLPNEPVGVPAHLLASNNDPWMSDSKAAYWALLWGANFIRLENLGHINSDSNIGIWPEGLQQLQSLVQRIRPVVPVQTSAGLTARLRHQP